jgi:hypothetical protein
LISAMMALREFGSKTRAALHSGGPPGRRGCAGRALCIAYWLAWAQYGPIAPPPTPAVKHVEDNRDAVDYEYHNTEQAFGAVERYAAAGKAIDDPSVITGARGSSVTREGFDALGNGSRLPLPLRAKDEANGAACVAGFLPFRRQRLAALENSSIDLWRAEAGLELAACCEGRIDRALARAEGEDGGKKRDPRELPGMGAKHFGR